MSSAEATDISEATTAEATLQQLRLHYTTEANVEASVHVQLDMTAEAAVTPRFDFGLFGSEKNNRGQSGLTV